MTIKEVEEQTGLSRSNIRFYEKEHLIEPTRNENNGYREYTGQNVEDIKKIAYLRTLGISIECIHQMIHHKVSLTEVIKNQESILKTQLADLKNAQEICRQMLCSEPISYEDLDITTYVLEPSAYWKSNKEIFQLDSINFLQLWGGFIMWAIITGISLLMAIFSYSGLPDLIPIQFSGEMVSSSVDKIFIFAFPAAMVLFRMLLRYCFLWKFRLPVGFFTDIIVNYLTNFICFVALSIEAFTILYVHGYVKNIVYLLLADAIIFIGSLLAVYMRERTRIQKSNKT